MPAETDPPRDPGATSGDRPFTTHPTGDALSKDLREVRTRPERAFNLGAALGLTLAVATFIFLVQNSGPTDFEWLWLDFELPLWAALVGALVVGAVLVLLALAVHRRRRRRIGRRERAAGRLEEALSGDEAATAPPSMSPTGPPTATHCPRAVRRRHRRRARRPGTSRRRGHGPPARCSIDPPGAGRVRQGATERQRAAWPQARGRPKGFSLVQAARLASAALAAANHRPVPCSARSVTAVWMRWTGSPPPAS